MCCRESSRSASSSAGSPRTAPMPRSRRASIGSSRWAMLRPCRARSALVVRPARPPPPLRPAPHHCTPPLHPITSAPPSSTSAHCPPLAGFCAMLRHLPRYTRGLDSALRADRLTRADLALLAPYLPNLGTAWMSAAAMTARDTGEAATVGARHRPAGPVCALARAPRSCASRPFALRSLSARRPKRLTRWSTTCSRATSR